jgi:hypothetical protein
LPGLAHALKQAAGKDLELIQRFLAQLALYYAVECIPGIGTHHLRVLVLENARGDEYI